MKRFQFLLTFIWLAFYSCFAQIQIGQDIDGEADTDFSGTSVSISSDGKRVAIGAPYNCYP